MLATRGGAGGVGGAALKAGRGQWLGQACGWARLSPRWRREAALKPEQSAARRAGLGVNGGRSVVAGVVQHGCTARAEAASKCACVAGAMMPCSALRSGSREAEQRREKGGRGRE